MKKIIFYISAVILFSSCNKDVMTPKVISGNAFGTTYSIKYYFEKDLDIENGIDSVLYLMNRSVSTYQENSDISKINRGDTSVVIDKIFLDNYNISLKVYNRSDGYFDPSIGVLRNAYGFGDTEPLQKIDQEVLDSLMRYVGFQKLELTSKNTIRKEHPNIYIDFNAVAKGYGIDRIGEYLESEGVSDYLIELGGELLARGTNIGTQMEWIAGIEAIDSNLEGRSFTAKVSLKDIAMASSGNYRKFRIDPETGEKYVHTINPLNGKAEKSDVTSATVLAPTCAYADAYATALMAMGLERSKELLSELDQIEAYLTYTTSDDQQGIYITDGFKENLVD